MAYRKTRARPSQGGALSAQIIQITKVRTPRRPPPPAPKIAPPPVPPPIQNSEPLLDGDIVVGAAAISKMLGITRRAVYHAISEGSIPSFRIGKTICIRRSTAALWIQAQEYLSSSGSGRK